MALEEQIQKYLDDHKDIRLTIILETYKKKATKKNIDAIKLLIEDGDIDSLRAFLGETKAEAPVHLEEFTHNQDDFSNQVKRILGDPQDPTSLGNRVLKGETFTGYLKTNIKPSVLFNKFATMSGKDQILIDEHPNFKTTPPIWEFAIAGTKTINRTLQHKVD